MLVELCPIWRFHSLIYLCKFTFTWILIWHIFPHSQCIWLSVLPSSCVAILLLHSLLSELLLEMALWIPLFSEKVTGCPECISTALQNMVVTFHACAERKLRPVFIFRQSLGLCVCYNTFPVRLLRNHGHSICYANFNSDWSYIGHYIPMCVISR